MAAMQYVVEGKRRLAGSIRPSGNKNAALPILAATLLTREPVVVRNLPRIRDVETMVELLRSVGAEARWLDDDEHALRVEARTVQAANISPALCGRIRASILLAAPLLVRSGEVQMPPPGGDVIGRRRLDTHLLALEQLGADVAMTELLELRAERLVGADIFLDEPSVTATENALMAAVAAEGTTVLRNCACEPHVQDLACFLACLGAEIDGAGTNRLTIRGGRPLGGGDFTIGPDHIEVGSFIGLAAVTGSGLRIERAGHEHLRSTRMGFERLGVVCRTDGQDLVVPAEQSRVIRPDLGGHIPKLEDQPWPGFPADLMSIAIVVATQCRGVILMHEKMFESRLFFVDKLVGMGARIVLCDPHRVMIYGPAALHAGSVESPDIRAGMAMLLAAMCAEGTSHINNVGQIERGYERLPDRLTELGADIQVVAERRR